MASLEQRKRRRKKFQSEKPMEVGPCELFMRSRKKSADIERLAHKYMRTFRNWRKNGNTRGFIEQKCTVESSTESESDTNTEVLSNSILYKQPLEGTSLMQLQFLDPYDGDYEEISDDSDCSLGSLDLSHSRAILLRHLLMEEGSLHAEQEDDSLSAPPPRALSKSVIQEDGSVTPKTAKILQLNTEFPSFMGPHPSKECGFFEGASSDSVLSQPTLMDCDSGLCEEHNTNRKQRRPVLESAGEKIKKRLRVT